MSNFEELGEVIANLGRPEFAPCLFRWLNTHIQADNVSVLSYHASTPPEVLYSSVTDRQLNRHLNEYYASGIYQLDPFYELHLNNAAAGAYVLRAIAPDRFERNAYYLQFYQRSGMMDELAFVCRPSDASSVHLCLSRTAKYFSSHDMRRARTIAPVVVALIEQNWTSLPSGLGERSKDASFSEQLRKSLAQQDGILLTPRQAEVAVLILQGHSTNSAALNLNLSPQTVKVFRKQLYRRCNISSQSELFSFLMPRLNGSLR